jgi:hypothetical protein
MMRAKFRLDRIERNGEGSESETCSIWMTPVMKTDNPDDENSRFWRWTPAGQLLLSTLNPAAVEGMTAGAEYYVDITPA